MAIRQRIQDLLGIPPAAKPTVYLQVYESAEFVSLNYGMELLLAAGIATLGLVLNSPVARILDHGPSAQSAIRARDHRGRSASEKLA